MKYLSEEEPMVNLFQGCRNSQLHLEFERGVSVSAGSLPRTRSRKRELPHIKASTFMSALRAQAPPNTQSPPPHNDPRFPSPTQNGFRSQPLRNPQAQSASQRALLQHLARLLLDPLLPAHNIEPPFAHNSRPTATFENEIRYLHFA